MSQCQVCGKPGEWVYDSQGCGLAIVCDNPPCQRIALQDFRTDNSEQNKADEASEPKKDNGEG